MLQTPLRKQVDSLPQFVFFFQYFSWTYDGTQVELELFVHTHTRLVEQNCVIWVLS